MHNMPVRKPVAQSKYAFGLSTWRRASAVRYRVEKRRYRIEFRGLDEEQVVFPPSLPRGVKASRRWLSAGRPRSTGR